MLLQSNMVKRLTDVLGGDLEAKTGESLRVKRIECIPSDNDDYLTISVDRVTIAFYRVKGKSGNHLGTIHESYLKRNIMEFLTVQGINVTIPVAEGQTLNVTRADEAGDVVLIYDRYSAGDVKETDPNGSASKIYTFIQYAEISETPDDSGDFIIDTSLSPAEFPDFPCGKVVPALHTIELLGIAASPIHIASAAYKCFQSSYLKLIRNREVLFDTDRDGIPFEGMGIGADRNSYRAAFSLIGSGTEIDLIDVVDTLGVKGDGRNPTPGQPLMFDPPLKFSAGEELNAYLTLTLVAGEDWVANYDDEAFILRVRRT